MYGFMTMVRSYVVSWNLTRRCNLRCQHCYLDAGKLDRDARQQELSTAECLRVVDELSEVSPEALLILTGGEPLMRVDMFDIAKHASALGLWVVVGTNGLLINERLCDRMGAAGIRGVALSIDSHTKEGHDGFRGFAGAWRATVEATEVLRRAAMPFIVQTTITSSNLHELADIARLAHELGAVVFNTYFLVPSGRGTYVSDISPEQYEQAMEQLADLQQELAGKLRIGSKCAPHFQRVLYRRDPRSPLLTTYSDGAGGCPAGTHYLGIRPNGDVTPCPYLPVFGGNLRTQSLSSIWNDSEVFTQIRARNALGGRCGSCEYVRVCGGCRARAYGANGDVMAEDPWCVHEPGSHSEVPIRLDGVTTYGTESNGELVWTARARARLKHVPGFVRGMVTKRIERYARDNGETVVTVEIMHAARHRSGQRLAGVPQFVRNLLAPR